MSAQLLNAPVPKLKKTTRAVIFSLIGGILILMGGASRVLVMTFASSSILPALLDPAYLMFSRIGMLGGLTALMIAAIEAVSGLFVIFAAIMMHHRPHRAPYWGNWVLAWSFVSLIGTGGLLFGAVLGIIGGAFALLLRPSSPKTYPAFWRRIPRRGKTRPKSSAS